MRRAYRINDSLPDDARKSPKWLWQRGGWLLVDRSSGKITLLKLPDFDPFYSEVSWYRDYAAYCGLTTNGRTGAGGDRARSATRSRCFARNWARTVAEMRPTATVPRHTGSASRRA